MPGKSESNFDDLLLFVNNKNEAYKDDPLGTCEYLGRVALIEEFMLGVDKTD